MAWTHEYREILEFPPESSVEAILPPKPSFAAAVAAPQIDESRAFRPGLLGWGLSSGEDDVIFLDANLKQVTIGNLLATNDHTPQVKREPPLGIDPG